MKIRKVLRLAMTILGYILAFIGIWDVHWHVVMNNDYVADIVYYPGITLVFIAFAVIGVITWRLDTYSKR